MRLKQLARALRLILPVPIIILLGASSAPPDAVGLARGDSEALARYLDSYLSRALYRHGVPGVSAILVDEKGVLWARGFGYADPARRVRATPETVYQVGSISKLVTATAVMRAVEQGQLALDAPVQTYLPRFRMRSRWPEPVRPTLRALLSHHAGMPTYYLKGFFSDAPLSTLVSELGEEHLAYRPGTVFNYSNVGIDIAGAALEHVAGKPFAAHLQASLLDPLGMHTSSYQRDTRVKAKLATGHVKRRPISTVTIRDVPAGGLHSNVQDLGRFMRLFLREGELDGKRLLRPQTVHLMLSPQFAGLPLDFGQHFGLGWMLSGIQLPGAGKTAWHNGGTKTFLGQMIVLPERKLGVVVLANSDRAATLVYEAAEEILRRALQVRDGISPPPPTPRAPAVVLPDATLDRYTGNYSLMGALAQIGREGSRLKLKVLGHKLDLVATSERNFRAEWSLFGLTSVPIPFPPIEFVGHDERTFMLWRDRGVAVTAERVPPFSVPLAWQRRTGTYRLLNPDRDYLVDLEHAQLLYEDGMLLMELRIAGLEDRDIKVVIMPIDDRTSYTFGIGRNVGDVTLVEDYNGKERVRYLGYYFERIESAVTQLAGAAGK